MEQLICEVQICWNVWILLRDLRCSSFYWCFMLISLSWLHWNDFFSPLCKAADKMEMDLNVIHYCNFILVFLHWFTLNIRRLIKNDGQFNFQGYLHWVMQWGWGAWFNVSFITHSIVHPWWHWSSSSLFQLKSSIFPVLDKHPVSESSGLVAAYILWTLYDSCATICWIYF